MIRPNQHYTHAVLPPSTQPGEISCSPPLNRMNPRHFWSHWGKQAASRFSGFGERTAKRTQAGDRLLSQGKSGRKALARLGRGEEQPLSQNELPQLGETRWRDVRTARKENPPRR